MTLLGHIRIKDYLEKTKGNVCGLLVTDGKTRPYSAQYKFTEDPEGYILVSRSNGTGDEVKLKPTIDLDESLVSFFGLYSGDGSKGNISFSQREPNLIRFAVEQFRRIFPGSIHFNFCLGEDSAFFMEGEGLMMLENYYGGKIPEVPPLSDLCHKLSSQDLQYLRERRPVVGKNEDHLSFYYFYKKAMESLLASQKSKEIELSGVKLTSVDRVSASLRRPFKKGARKPGGSSRSDEIYIGGLTGFNELFLKMLHEIEESIHKNTKISTQGLVSWIDVPSDIGESINIKNFFLSNNYGVIGGERPYLQKKGIYLEGKWPRSKDITIKSEFIIDPLWCYVSGLYLAEGRTPKHLFFSMFERGLKGEGLSLGFTSSENISIDLMLSALGKLFLEESCMDAWKIKVGSQYFPELVVIGLKNGVPMLRGGNSGDGKLRTMEISLALKDWALELAPSLKPYSDKYSHVEPTGAGLARIDFWSSSALCKWFFPLIMYAVFGRLVNDPARGFKNG